MLMHIFKRYNMHYYRNIKRWFKGTNEIILIHSMLNNPYSANSGFLKNVYTAVFIES